MEREPEVISLAARSAAAGGRPVAKIRDRVRWEDLSPGERTGRAGGLVLVGAVVALGLGLALYLTLAGD